MGGKDKDVTRCTVYHLLSCPSPHIHPQRNLVALLVSSINYLEHSQRYEVMAEVFKLLQPFYEKQRDFPVGKKTQGHSIQLSD